MQPSRYLHVEPREREFVKPLELYFDLVFVLGFTRCTALMVDDPTWAGVGRALLVLAMLWWAWVGYAWMTSVIDPEEGAVRIAMFAAMAGLLVVTLCMPEAYGERALGFALAYAAVRGGHAVIYLLVSRGDPGLRRSVSGYAVSTTLAVAALVVGALLDDGARVAMWGLAVLIDLVGPALFGIEGWRLVPEHFAERHNLVVIIALGESFVALGVAAEVELTTDVIVAAVLGVALVSALWWVYFDVVAIVTRERLARASVGRARNALARDSYSFLHFPMVAGIVLAAFGLEETVLHLDEHLHAVPAAALLGGVALYLLGHVALRLRNARTINPQRLGLAVLLVALIPVATDVPAMVTLVAVTAPLWLMIAYETARYGDGRYRLRHGLDFDPPPPGLEPEPS